MTRLLIRLARWHRRPPSRQRLAILGVVLAVAALLVAIEHTLGWPDWLTAERVPIRR